MVAFRGIFLELAEIDEENVVSLKKLMRKIAITKITINFEGHLCEENMYTVRLTIIITLHRELIACRSGNTYTKKQKDSQDFVGVVHALG